MIISIPEVIKLERLRNGLTLRALSDISGVHYSTISQMERKPQAVSPKTAKRLSEALSQTIETCFQISIEERDTSA